MVLSSNSYSKIGGDQVKGGCIESKSQVARNHSRLITPQLHENGYAKPAPGSGKLDLSNSWGDM